MSRKKPKYAALFKTALTDYAHRHNMSTQQMSELAGYSKREIERWSAGTTVPSETTLRVLCGKFSWDFEKFLLEASIDGVITSHFLALDALQDHYRRAYERHDAIAAYRYATDAAAHVVQHLRNHGLDNCFLHADSRGKESIKVFYILEKNLTTDDPHQAEKVDALIFEFTCEKTGIYFRIVANLHEAWPLALLNERVLNERVALIRKGLISNAKDNPTVSSTNRHPADSVLATAG